MPATEASRSSRRSRASSRSTRRVMTLSMFAGEIVHRTRLVDRVDEVGEEQRVAARAPATSASRSPDPSRPAPASPASRAASPGGSEPTVIAGQGGIQGARVAADQQHDHPGTLVGSRADGSAEQIGGCLIDPLGVLDDDERSARRGRSARIAGRRGAQAGAAELLGQVVDRRGRRDRRRRTSRRRAAATAAPPGRATATQRSSAAPRPPRESSSGSKPPRLPEQRPNERVGKGRRVLVGSCGQHRQEVLA